MSADALNSAMPDPHKPDLSVRMLGEQQIRSFDRILGHLISASFDINRHNLPLVTGFELRTDALLIDFLTPPGELLGAVSWLRHCHTAPLLSVIYTNLTPFTGSGPFPAP